MIRVALHGDLRLRVRGAPATGLFEVSNNALNEKGELVGVRALLRARYETGPVLVWSTMVLIIYSDPGLRLAQWRVNCVRPIAATGIETTFDKAPSPQCDHGLVR
jgi:hypothetical protein